MTVLTIVQDVVQECGWTESPTAVMTSTDKTIIQLRLLLGRVGKYARDLYPWPILIKEGTATLVASTANYALPADFNHDIFFNTTYNRNEYWPVYGPVTPQDWQYLKGTASTSPSLEQQFRVKGLVDNRFYLDPTPGTADAGHVIYFEYLSKSWLRPRTWANGQTYAAGAYCFYNGVYYQTASGGVTATGATAGPAADIGVVDWTAGAYAYDSPLLDTDVSNLEEYIIEQGLKAFFRKEKRLDGWEDDMAEFDNVLAMYFGRMSTGAEIRIDGGASPAWPNIPRTGFNNYIGP